jgi:hypothetical protein
VSIEITAISIGARAARLLSSRADWIVAATFERSFYLRSGDAFICIGDPTIGDGPLNAIVAHLPSISIGTPCRIDAITAMVWHVSLSPISGGEGQGEGRQLAQKSPQQQPMERVRTSSNPSPSDRPARRCPSLAPEGAGEREGLLMSAVGVAPPESFIHAMTDREPVSLIFRRVRIGIAALQRGDFESAVTAVAGLGHGLTPSGDDLLAGALLMLHASGQTARGDALAAAVRRIAPARTSPLSYALLEPACDGEPNEAVANAITALLADAPPAEVIDPLRRVGATSGFDLLAGMLSAVQAGGA